MSAALPYWRLSGFYFFYFALLGGTAPFLAQYLRASTQALNVATPVCESSARDMKKSRCGISGGGAAGGGDGGAGGAGGNGGVVCTSQRQYVLSCGLRVLVTHRSTLLAILSASVALATVFG